MPKPELLETFPNPYADRAYEIHMICPEFTSLCPLGGVESDAAELSLLQGGAPDFATMYLTYVPAEFCVELKSLKLYLWSFRNDGDRKSTRLNSSHRIASRMRDPHTDWETSPATQASA